MSVNYNPKIVTDGLVANYDFGSAKCYQRTENLLLYSEEWNTSPWGTAGTGTVTRANNSEVSPINDRTATLHDVTVYGAGISVYQDLLVSGTSTVTASFYFKPGTITANPTLTIFFRIGGTLQGFNTTINGQTGAIVSYNTSFASSTPLGNGWYKISTTVTGTDPLNTSIRYQIYYNGPGTMYTWGAQLEINSEASEYVKTTSSAITRGTTAIGIDKNALSGTLANRPWYSSTDKALVLNGSNHQINIPNFGTTFNFNSAFSIGIMLKFTALPTTESMAFFGMYNGTSNTGVFAESNSNKSIRFCYRINGTNTFDIYQSDNQFVNNVAYHLMFTYDGATAKVYKNGIQLDVTGSGTNMPGFGASPSQFGVGYLQDVGRYSKIKIYNFNIYKRALSADEIKRNFNAIRGRGGI